MTDISFLGDTAFERVTALMSRLRKDCPWDSTQTFESIAPYTIEEAYEVSDAIDRKDMSDLKQELGDLLFQVLFHSEMAAEAEAFDMEDVCDALTTKMVDRHPHVFTSPDDTSSVEHKQEWESLKAQERQAKGYNSLLDDVPLALPELMRAEKLQKRAARVGFDWPDLDGVLDKIVEEAHEVAEVAKTKDPDKIEDEIGDLIFAVTNLSRKLGVDPELALRRTNTKFTRRFQHIEANAKSQSRPVNDMSLDEMEALWQAAKTVS